MSTDLPNPANPLIPVFATEIGGVPTQAVDARELHGFLDIGRDFSNWIKKRIADYGFIEGTDYSIQTAHEVLAKSGENPQSGRPSIEYVITLDMAKELAMVERNEMGRTIRRYFIDCERAALQAASAPARIKNLQGLNQILPPHFHLKNTSAFKLHADTRILFWTLEKRDRLLHPAIDREALFQVTLDIQHAIQTEFVQATLSRFPDTCSVNDPDLINFVRTWRPSFAAEVH
ncbi:antA/AntB antirepressor family protein [Methylobacter sp. BlB1]|uniref:antA/AntB antirepressor family protein n=1 Tax=Methylobacter sp. BlB1 TaxID=2785914 RepID=UPI001893B3DA|nr:antA/AntB antirepressor family protein [Methylobacter sp. BlB1]MBF6649131.1 antA/AntB antirepressor family protein [Methylobacter sp. BlB1]